MDSQNAEIGLGTIHDMESAKRWLEGTFLYVRLGKNPNHYKIDGDSAEKCLNDRIEQICQRDINLLHDTNLVTSGANFKSTEFGDAMARYYIRFETMQKLLSLPRQARMSEIVSRRIVSRAG
jgi:ATP-dependent DNA helicase HFM1/MER3